MKQVKKIEIDKNKYDEMKLDIKELKEQNNIYWETYKGYKDIAIELASNLRIAEAALARIAEYEIMDKQINRLANTTLQCIRQNKFITNLRKREPIGLLLLDSNLVNLL